MKSNMKSLLVAVSMLFAVGFTACDESSTTDIKGPSIDFTFNYTDILRSTDASSWQLIASSDTIEAIDIAAFLSKDTATAKYMNVVKAASFKNGELIVTGGNYNFNGVDSVKIVYKLVGSSQEVEFVAGAPIGQNNDTIFFKKITIIKAAALEMLQTRKVCSIYAIYNSQVVNCFQPGAVYNFKADTYLTVPLADAAGMLGNL